ncbi:hypothetical protein DCS32_15515 [Dokdonia sp. Dokd-P16]|uniref:PDDEXK-like family protein n=1 Tax=Dokdonia sp. Dokd-P16 TaxID=2173169 RepID=UPI000D54515B|nr:PD-(D/E)XK nuclease family protein [Dokdonia sp. Dokd-P16]AWH75519.1 hypothetical protein DCS32_15515 [Dokdonia sp. Dokd-P16]
MPDEKIHNLLSHIGGITKSYDRLNKLTGERLNLFSLLRKESDEVRLHSRFIAELLDPQGKHDQGSLFLDLFLEAFEIEDINSSTSKLHVEFYIGVISKDRKRGGNIDILIDDGVNCVKIENKIYAGEQHNQLLRYHNYKPGHLIFLTLYGNASTNHKELIEIDVHYEQRSYRNDILNWLSRCVEKVALIPNLRESIVQYQNLIKKLTKQNINYQMNSDITKKITDNQENFEAYLSIRRLENDNSIYKQIIKKTIIPFFEEFAGRNNLTPHLLEKSLLKERAQHSGFFFDNEFLRSIGLKLGVQFGKSNNRDMYYGLSFYNPSIQDSEFFRLVFDESKKILPKTRRTDWWLTSNYWDEFLDWSDIDTLYNIAYGSFKIEFEENMCNLLRLVESLYEKTNSAN